MSLTNKTSAIILIAICTTALIFHSLVLLKVIPYSVTWGGRLTSYDEVLIMVPVSLAINLFFILIVAIKAGFINITIPITFLNGVLWAMAIIFALNTVGNLAAITWLEKAIATPLTLVASILAFRLARTGKTNK